MSDVDFSKEFDALVQKYAELLTGQSNSEIIKKVKIWALYSHINKTMPALVKHWVQDNPEAKDHMRHIFEEVQKLNQEHKTSKDQK